MKKILKLLPIVTASLTCNLKAQEASTNTRANGYPVRILLEKHPLKKPYTMTLKTVGGFVLENPAHSKMLMSFTPNELKLTIKDGFLYMKCEDGIFRRIKNNDLEVYSPHNVIIHNDQSYQGSIRICQNKEDDSILTINTLGLEDYLYSVVRYESVPSWPIEVQKAQVVASRTYALYHMKKTRSTNPQSLYDLTNNIYSQVYKGLHGETYLRRAVQETQNMILTYHGEVAEAMFGACCGGIIPGNIRETQDPERLYLYRNTPCKYCKNSAYYNWQKVFPKNKLLSCLRSNHQCKEKLQNFTAPLVNFQIIDKDKAGVVHKVACSGETERVTLSGAKVRRALRLKSLAYSIAQDGNLFVFNGHGYHHFKGLCQWGAKTLADQGLNYKEILQFYYPDTKISVLK